MSKSSPSRDLRESAGFLAGLVKQARLSWRLFRDGRVPGWLKLVPIASLLYLLSPVDILPDLVLPGLGQIDDLAMLLLAAKVFVDLSPPGVVREHLAEIFGVPRESGAGSEETAGYIDAPYHFVDDEE
ncbi:MAG TPA: DUF1232 domain-containing protein [Anaerolineae bacterium]|nr:DUF1232 domain-containing protein [Anaerolineae bacterium]